MKLNSGYQLFIILVVLASGATEISAQPAIYLEETFREASIAWVVKRKGLSAIGKYEFGPYRIVSGKAGWTRTKSKTGMFSADFQSESQTRSSFVFTGNQSDTLNANLLTVAVVQVDEKFGFLFRTLTNWSLKEITESYEVFAADFNTNIDTALWQLVIAYPVGDEIRGTPTQEEMGAFKGSLSNGATTILIQPEFRHQSGKTPALINPVEGYIFSMEGNPIAAIQTAPYNKRTVWIVNSLPQITQFILAASSAALLIKSDQNGQ